MAYVLPQVRVFQEYSLRPVAEANPLSACLIGGNAHLVRVSEPAEKPDGYLGIYDGLSDDSYVWPNRPAGGIIDESYTKVFVENALLHYFDDPTGSGSTIVPVAGYTNRIRSATVNFKETTGYARNANLYSRDVQIGDVVRVRGTPSGPGADGPVTLWTHVRGLVPDNIAATFGDVAEDSNNAGTQIAAVSISQTGGEENWVEATANGSAYDGTADGYTSETYVVRVIDGSVDGDFTTASLRVLSSSGTDDHFDVIPAAAGLPTSIGSRGLLVTFDLNAESESSASWSEEDFGSSDLIAGQEFTVTVSQAYTAQDMSLGTGASYTGTNSTTYVVEFIRGGAVSNSPTIVVTTTDGSDQSGPHVVTGEDVTIPIGTKGVTIQFPNTGALSPLRFNKGDRFYLPVTGVQEGPVRTLVLADSLASSFTTSDELSVDLYVRHALLELPENRVGSAPDKNWSQTATEVTVYAGAVAFSPDLHDNGTPVPLDVISESSLGYGKVYVEYRAWLQDLCGSVLSLSDVSDLDQVPGPDTPDNPLKFYAKSALSNNNGVPVYLVSVCDPESTDSWAEALDLTTSYDSIYTLVPLTTSYDIFQLVQAHAQAQSSPTECLWRSCVFPLFRIPEIPIVAAGSTVPTHTTATTTDGESALAVFEDDPNTSGTQYTRVRVPANNAKFVTNGVRAGDILRGIYSGDGFGDFTYQEFIVDAVESENVLRLQTGPSVPYDVASKIEVWRTLSATDEAREIGRVASSFGSNRVCAVFPVALDPTYTLSACAAVAGLMSGVLPQQGLTNVALSGLTSYVGGTSRFGKDQLNLMAESGVWIVDRTLAGTIRTRHAVTTADYNNIDLREESIRRNFDSVSYRFKDFFAPYIGVTNVTSSMRAQIETDFSALVSQLQSERATAALGGQIVSASLVRFETSDLYRDKYLVYASVRLPYALNNLDIYLALE